MNKRQPFRSIPSSFFSGHCYARDTLLFNPNNPYMWIETEELEFKVNSCYIVPFARIKILFVPMLFFTKSILFSTNILLVKLNDILCHSKKNWSVWGLNGRDGLRLEKFHIFGLGNRPEEYLTLVISVITKGFLTFLLLTNRDTVRNTTCEFLMLIHKLLSTESSELSIYKVCQTYILFESIL